MFDTHNKERWHSYGCLLYCRGGHHGTLHEKGYTCPLSVLHYMVLESVILFHAVDELKHASHGIAKVTELQDDAIMVKAMAPLEAHITTYTMV